jgi:hypothetical protein
LDPQLEAALNPILADLIATGGLLLDVRESDAHSVWSGSPSYLRAMVWAPDGSGTGIALQERLPFAAQVAELAEQMQEIAIEARWKCELSATWPECPSHPNSHPLEPALVSGHAVWRCPRSGETIAEIGTLPRNWEDHPDLDADEYEAMTGVSRVQYEAAFLTAAKENFTGRQLDWVGESVRLDAVSDTSVLEVVFRVDRVPGRKFGWRASIWPVPDPREAVGGTPEDLASLLSVHLMETVNDLPHRCRVSMDEHGVEWIDDAS